MKKTNTRIMRGSGNVFIELGFPPHKAAVMLPSEIARNKVDKASLDYLRRRSESMFPLVS